MRFRRGFSLLELLIVMGLLVLVGGLALRVGAAVSTRDAGIVAQRLQSRLQGLRERAGQCGRPVGLRLVRDPHQPGLVVGLVGLQSGTRLAYGSSGTPVQFERGTPGTGEVTRVRGLTSDCDWQNLVDRGHLGLPFRLRIPAGQGEWYSVVSLSAESGRPGEIVADLATPLAEGLVIQPSPATVATPAGSPWATCEVETRPTCSAAAENWEFPAGWVIDLAHSRLPGDWQDATELDVVCDPQGELVGLGRSPLIWLIRPREDAERRLDVAHPECRGGAVAVVLRPGSGRVEVSMIDPTDEKNNQTGAAGADGLADDPLRMALATGGER